jgi:hypothetical protein
VSRFVMSMMKRDAPSQPRSGRPVDGPLTGIWTSPRCRRSEPSSRRSVSDSV